jgi:hypothetical protein
MKHLLFLRNIIDRAHTIGHCLLWRILGSLRNRLIQCGHRAEFHKCVSARVHTVRQVGYWSRDVGVRGGRIRPGPARAILTRRSGLDAPVYESCVAHGRRGTACPGSRGGSPRSPQVWPSGLGSLARQSIAGFTSPIFTMKLLVMELYHRWLFLKREDRVLNIVGVCRYATVQC